MIVVGCKALRGTAFLTLLFSDKIRLLKTLSIWTGTFCIGLSIAVVGATLLDLQQQVATDLTSISYLLPARSAGYVVGSLFLPLLYSRMDFMLSSFISLAISSILTFGIAFLTTLPSLMAVFAGNGFALGFFDTGAYIFVIELWGLDAVPFMQILISMIGIGSLLAPVIAEPFLTKPDDIVTDAAVMRAHALLYPYSIIGTLLACSALFSLCLFVNYPSEKEKEVPGPVEERTETKDETSKYCCTITWKALVIGLIVVLIHVFYGIQVCFGSYLLTFAVKSDLMLSKTTGALMTTLYWTCYTFFKFPVMLLSGKDNGWILVFSFTAVLLSSIILLLYGGKDEKILWIGIAMLGSSMSPIWACVFGYLQQWLQVTELIGSLLVVSSMMAEFVFPAIISSFIADTPAVLMWITIFCSCSMISLFAVAMVLCHTKLKSK